MLSSQCSHESSLQHLSMVTRFGYVCVQWVGVGAIGAGKGWRAGQARSRASVCASRQQAKADLPTANPAQPPFPLLVPPRPSHVEQ